MALFSKKPKQPGGAPGSPLQQIMAMQQQGLDNNVIVEEMQKQGFNATQIYDAMNQAQMQAPTALPGAVPEAVAETQPSMAMPDPAPMPEMPAPEMAAPEPTGNRDVIEEIAEAIIDEKWKEFEEDLRKIIEWKDQTETHITQLTQQIQDLSTSVNSLHKNILNKISDYDKNIVDVGTEIKAMEKVFQKVLPTLTENVNKLERMTKKK